jgi:hypothetical protein
VPCSRKLIVPDCPGGDYLGNCIDCCGGYFGDATEMAQFIDNSEVLEKSELRVIGVKGKIKWIHDLEVDVHFFFRMA